MTKQPAQIYTVVAGLFSLFQGITTLVFRQFPALDQAFPAYLATTQMIPAHSVLHILTGVLALFLLLRGGERGPIWFAVGFGVFYLSLGFVGMISGHPAILGLQPFDHGIHFAIGGLGLMAAGLQLYRANHGMKVSL